MGNNPSNPKQRALALVEDAAATLFAEATRRDFERGDALADYARSGRTQRAYESDVRQWLAYAKERGVRPFPISEGALVAYLGHMDERYKLATARRHLAALSQWHQSRGELLPMTAAVRERIKGLGRKKGKSQVAKRAFTLEQILEMVSLMGEAHRDVRDRAILLVGFQTSARRSELAALTWEDVTERPDGWLVLIRQSKTDQEGEGRLVTLPDEPTPFSALAALRQWREVQSTYSGSMFGVSPRTIARCAQRHAAVIGLDASAYGAHSFRSGFATEADRLGASKEDIQGQTHHKDIRMVDRYIQRRRQAENPAARALAGGLREMAPQKPRGYEDDLGDYRVLLVDSACGEPVSWGFPLVRYLGEDRFRQLAEHGELVCLDHINGGKYGLVARRLTHEQAIRKYGEVTDREVGPRGGWRSITYGKTRFLSRLDGA